MQWVGHEPNEKRKCGRFVSTISVSIDCITLFVVRLLFLKAAEANDRTFNIIYARLSEIWLG